MFNISSKRQKETASNSNELLNRKIKCDSVCLAKLFIAITIILTITGIVLLILLSLSIQKILVLPTITNSTTTNSTVNTTLTRSASTSNSTNNSTLQIGASCLYNNQCPQYAFCEGTCKCPFHYYYNASNQCIIKKTNGAGCSNDFECNTNIGLTCQSGTCQCDSVHFWNSTYVLGGGLPNGRCQNQKTYGTSCSGATTNEYASNNYCSSRWASQINRVSPVTGNGYYFSLSYGSITWSLGDFGFPCFNTQECRDGASLCMSPNNEGNSRCVPFPTKYIWSGWTYGKIQT
jgi:hypothetical protein